ncbi:MAG: hypothetical protein O2967_21925 [Proteobacteria bacterium]|nr:hypothetical protein [Pseudomonadota bacterium]
MRWINGIAVIVLLGAWPFLHFAVQNLALHTDIGLSLPRLLAAAGGLIAAALGLWAGVSLMIRRIPAERWAAATGVGIMSTFLFGAMAGVMQEHGFFRYSQTVVWSLGTALLLLLVWRLSRSPAFSRKLIIMAVALNLFALLPLVFLQPQDITEPGTEGDAPDANPAATAPKASLDPNARRPNVYFFVFDEYARADQLKKLFDIDNAPFLNALSNRGFIIGEQSFANFPMTLLSVSSTLSMNYVVAEGKVFDWWGDGARKAARVIDGYNPVVNRFHELGYKYVHGGGEGYVRCGNAEDLCIRATPVTWITEQERLLMLMTPLRLFRYRFRFAANKFTPTVVKKAVEKFAGHPRFVYAHFMIPRSSVYREDCSTVAVLDGMMGVAALPRHDPELMRQRKMRYANDIRCVNPTVIDLVDTILANDTDPIIIIQSDHGPTYLHDWSTPFWPDDHYRERYGILNAIRLPNRCRHQLYPTMSPVNTFRIVLECVDGRPRGLLEDVSFSVRSYKWDPAQAHHRRAK